MPLQTCIICLHSAESIYWVYVLENELSRWYIGSTGNLEFRLKRHNNQRVKSTKNRGIWNIIYKENCKTRSEVMRREEYLKSGAGRKLLKDLLNQQSSVVAQW